MVNQFPLAESALFDTITASRIQRPDPSTGKTYVERMGTSGRGSALTIGYNAAAGTYTIADRITDWGGPTSVTFGAADLKTSSRNADSYEKLSGTVTDRLVLYGNVQTGGSQTAPSLPLTYLSFGIWTHADTASAVTRKSYLLFGYPTTEAEMPRTGTASYKTFVTGNIFQLYPRLGISAESDLRGSAAFDANFGSGTVNTTLALQRVDNHENIGTFVGAGTIYATDQFSGSFTSGPAYFHTGVFMGGFFGPSASEMGYAFYIRKYNPDPYAGAAPAHVDDWIVGAVVGAKQ